MVALPRLVVAAPSTGQGKTTVATGLMAALRLAGHEVSGHKVGPDYIDPGYHALATGRPGRNLDPHLVGEERIVPLLLHGASGADVAVIEGVMGLYDGRLGTDGFSSTAHVAKLTRSPVVLVLDVARMSRTAAAVAAGMAAYDDEVDIAGVILNRTGSARNDAEIVAAMERTGLPVLGLLPRDEALVTPSRHLGLVPAAERAGSAAQLDHLGARVGEHLDLDALLKVARRAPDIDVEPWDPRRVVRPTGAARPVIAMAAGRAFTFRYAETEELLRAAGCEVVQFDPVTDATLPDGTQGIYLGGGFPEVYAAQLTANRSLLTDLRAAAEAGIPTVAECAGLLYLAQTLDGAPMAGVVPATATMTERLTLRYPVATGAADTLLTRAGERVTGHEFHRTTTDSADHGSAWSDAWEVEGVAMGYATGTVHASYLHVHWAGHPQLAQRFADAARTAASHRPKATAMATRHTVEQLPVADPLRHHGDAETGAGLLDLAVNVYDGDRPAWLDRALHASLAGASAYPDVSVARTALSRRHGRSPEEVLPTAGAAEAFTLVARLRAWRRPVLIHPQFTEPHAALVQAGHQVTSLICKREKGFRFDPVDVPKDADLVVIGNPTNPTGVLHPAQVIAQLCRKGRVVVVDEAFMDAVPNEAASLVGERQAGLVILRSLTKHWSIPGIRAGYVVGDRAVISRLATGQPPWSVSTPAIAAMLACSDERALVEAGRRARTMIGWRECLQAALAERGIDFVPSCAPFVLARLGVGAHAALRRRGVAVRRADTFPGLDSAWVRIAVRPPEALTRLFAALDESA